MTGSKKRTPRDQRTRLVMELAFLSLLEMAGAVQPAEAPVEDRRKASRRAFVLLSWIMPADAWLSVGHRTAEEKALYRLVVRDFVKLARPAAAAELARRHTATS